MRDETAESSGIETLGNAALLHCGSDGNCECRGPQDSPNSNGDTPMTDALSI